MKFKLAHLLAGVYLGTVFVKSEVISWFRIQEMFYFKSIHMFGTFALAIATALVSVLIIKKIKLKTLTGLKVTTENKPFQKGIVFGGLIFGIGWGFTGACPGPIYSLLGTGEPAIFLILIGVFIGVLFFGITRKTFSNKTIK